MPNPGRPENLTNRSGRPKGAKNKPKNVKGIAAKLADDRIQVLLGNAIDIVQEGMRAERPSKDDPTVMVPDHYTRREMAKFLLARFGQPSKAKTYIEVKLKQVLENYDDIEKVSHEAMLLAMDGLMSFEQVEHLQKLLTTHAGIAGYMEVKALREQLEALANMRTIDGDRVVPEASRIEWGQGVQQPNSKGNGPDTPAE